MIIIECVIGYLLECEVGVVVLDMLGVCVMLVVFESDVCVIYDMVDLNVCVR